MCRSRLAPAGMAAAACIAAVAGCSVHRTRGVDSTVQTGSLRSRPEAARLNEQGISTAEGGNQTAAEKLFREALRREVTYAAAHNNLGLVLFAQRRYYEAAWEFDYAARLDRRSVEPLLNLGRLYEAVGCVSRAVRQYELAVERQPRDPEAGLRLGRLRGAGMPVPSPIDDSSPEFVRRANSSVDTDIPPQWEPKANMAEPDP